MKKIVAALAATSSVVGLFWFSAFPGAQQELSGICANNTPFNLSSGTGFTISNGDPHQKLCTIVNRFPAPANA